MGNLVAAIKEGVADDRKRGGGLPKFTQLQDIITVRYWSQHLPQETFSSLCCDSNVGLLQPQSGLARVPVKA